MRILLAQNSLYVPAHGGANKTNRLLLEQMAERGHECFAVSAAGGAQATGPGSRAAATGGGASDPLLAQGAEILAAGPADLRFRLRGVTVRAAPAAQLRAAFAEELRSRDPDFVLVSSEDPLQVLLREAVESGAGRVVYLAHTTLLLPFGPGCAFPFPPAVELLRQAAGIVTASRFMQDYVRRWSGLDAARIHLPVYGKGPFPDLAAFDRGALLMINPCAVKGLPIFLGLADAFPHLPFAGVRTWGTSEADLAALRSRPNVSVLDPDDDVDRIYGHARALLVPSLWQEAFGMVAVDAMLRGLPVLASDSGGLPEAKLGVEYVLPVRPIRKYRGGFDDRLMPRAELPEQDLAPWTAAVADLLGSAERYRDVSARSRSAALAFVESLSIRRLEEYLEGL